MVVMKFGGSSVATARAIARVRTIVEAERRPRVVIVSALGGVTDVLLGLAARAGSGDGEVALRALQELRDRHAAIAATVRDEGRRRGLQAALEQEWAAVAELVRSISLRRRCLPAAYDAVAARGELASSLVVAALLEDGGLPAEWVDGRDVVATDDRHQHASPLAAGTTERVSRRVAPLIDRGRIPVVGGFIGSTGDGVTTTLGRGGSDYSASLVGACLRAAEIQIWTDVDGMLTADPRLFGRARPVGHLSFDEAAALARFGAKVLHPSTIEPAAAAGIPVRILNSRDPAGRGTLVTGTPARRPVPVAGIASLGNLCAVQVALPKGATRTAAVAAVSEACAHAEAAVHLTSISNAGISVVLDDGPAAEQVIARLGRVAPVARRRRLALVTIVGDSLVASRSVAGRAEAACEGIPAHLVSRAPGSNHLALLVDEDIHAVAVADLHRSLVECCSDAVAGNDVRGPGRDGQRWSGLLRPWRRGELDRALEPLVAAGATGEAVVSLPLVDVEA